MKGIVGIKKEKKTFRDAKSYLAEITKEGIINACGYQVKRSTCNLMVLTT